ncbi:hypothetical protein ACJZ2D_011412 [Fusarium nematophilum]
MGVPYSIPSGFTVRLHALRILRDESDKFGQISDAISPGGSGDRPPYSRRPTSLAIHAEDGGTMKISPAGIHPPRRYPEDPIQAHRVQFETTIASITLGDAALQVKFIDSPERVLEDSNIVVIDGTSKGALIPTTRIQNGTATFPWITTQADLASLRPGDKFRDKQGKPLYPRRNVSIGRLGTLNSASCIQDGHITAPTLHLQNLMDIDAFPWKADWYKPAVKRALGSEANDQFVLWYTDHAQHDNPASMLAHAYTINFSGVLQQGLRDPAGWVETGRKPKATRYAVRNTQVHVPDTAEARGGIQPVIRLRADGRDRAVVRRSEPVVFTATIETPPGTGKVIAAE